MKKTSLLIAFYFYSIGSLIAQDVTGEYFRHNLIQLQFGIEQGYQKDLNFSPLNYTSGGLAIDAGYQRFLRNEDRLSFSLWFQSGKLNTGDYDFNTSDHYNFNLEIGYLKKISGSATGFNTYIGGQYHSYVDVVFFDGTEAFSFYGLHSIDLAGGLSWNISGRQTLLSTVSLPVFGLLVRPPWTGWNKYIEDHESNPVPIFFNGNWTSLNNFLAFNLNVQYQYALSTRWDVAAKYQFRYYRTEELKTAIIPIHQFTVGTNFKF
jgi:hypothetical protein